MSRIATFTLIVALLGACGCATHKQTTKSAFPATTPYDTNAAARAVYLKFYEDAHRIAAAGRTNITYDYRGEHVRAATDGQWQGVHAGLQIVRERELQRLRRGPRLPKSTPYDAEPELRATYLRSYRDNYIGELSGRHGISCFPQTRATEAYCAGERDGQRQAQRDTMAVEVQWIERYGHLTDCMAKQHPKVARDSSPSGFSILRALIGL
jgi:hypothetical protein